MKLSGSFRCEISGDQKPNKFYTDLKSQGEMINLPRYEECTSFLYIPNYRKPDCFKHPLVRENHFSRTIRLDLTEM